MQVVWNETLHELFEESVDACQVELWFQVFGRGGPGGDGPVEGQVLG